MATSAAAAAPPATPPTWRFPTPFHFLRRFRRDPIALFRECQRRCGDVARIAGPAVNGYLLLDAGAVRHVLQENHRNYWKGRVFQRLTRFAGNGLLFSEGDFWLRQRRLAAPAFHRRAVEGWAGRMAARAEALADRWQAERRDEVVDAAQEMADLVLEIVAEALFGTDVEDYKARFAHNLAFGVEYANWLLNSLAPWPIWVPTRRNRRIRRYMAELDEFLLGAVEARRARPAEHGDLLSMLLAARDDETAATMSDRQVLDESVTFISAGYETSAMALAWCWALLSAHLDVEARLHAELDEVLGGRLPTLADLPALPFLRRVVDEVLRLYPPGWVIARQSLEADEIQGWAIVPRAFVFLCPYLSHRHPDYWDAPERFDPDRFLPERSEGRPRFAYFPFGGGARLCIGREFALLEIQLVLATLARRFRLRAVGDAPPAPDPIFTLRPRGGVPVRLEPRGPR